MINTAKFSHSIFFRWMGLSTLGWVVGVFSTIFLIFLYSGTGFNTDIYNFSPLLDSIIGIFIWLPLGFSLGILQWLQLRRWSVKLSWWTWITAFGWWAISIYFDGDVFYSPQFGSIILLIILGTLLGVSQAFILRNVFSRSELWVLANVFGVCALVFLQFHFLFPPYSDHSTFLEKLMYQLFAESNQPLYNSLSTYTEEISILVFPFIGALTTAVLTGLLLAKFIGSKSRDEVSSIVSIAG